MGLELQCLLPLDRDEYEEGFGTRESRTAMTAQAIFQEESSGQSQRC
jgi:hypothetical protein